MSITIKSIDGLENVNASSITTSSLTVNGSLSTVGINNGTFPLTTGGVSGTSYSFQGYPTNLIFQSFGGIGNAVGGVECFRVNSTENSSFQPLNMETQNITNVGTISCTSLTSSNAITQKEYFLRVYLNASQTLTSTPPTAVVWDTIETIGGGSSNFSFTPPGSLITIPFNGTYQVIYELTIAQNASGIRQAWVEINSSTPNTKRRYGELSGMATSTSTSNIGTGFQYKFSAGDTIMVVGFQNSGSTLSFVGLSTGTLVQCCSLQIYRIGA